MVLWGRSGFSRCGKIEKSTTPSVRVAGGRLPVDEALSDARGHHHAPGAHAHPDRRPQRRQEVGEAGRPQPVAQVRGIAAFHEQDVRLSDEGNPALLVEARQRGELQHAHRLPTQPNRGGSGLLPADAPPRLARSGAGVAVQRRGNAESVALGDRLAQQLDERVLDARVLDAGGGEEKFHDFPSVTVRSRRNLSARRRRSANSAARPAAPSRRTRRSRRRLRLGGLPSGMPRPGRSRDQCQVPIAVPYSSSDATTRKTPA